MSRKADYFKSTVYWSNLLRIDSHEANFSLFHAIYLLGIEKQHLPRRDLLSNKLGRRHAEIQRHHGDLNPVQSDLHQAEQSSLQDNLFK